MLKNVKFIFLNIILVLEGFALGVIITLLILFL